METLRSRGYYPNPPTLGRIRQVCLFREGMWYELQPISWGDLIQARASTDVPVEGIPVYYALAGNEGMALYPVPDAEYEISRTWNGARADAPC